ncbi:MAG TPA: Rieske 2Fe-2S domain-containing protein [Steroidobacteraceae bacterium]|nr:Rieske 2Fe-2S domain-containing protein [Steroidobacteraceae bacterium]
MNHADNDILCRVEGDAPMGRLMRAHWLPACMSEEVAERDGAPVRARLLGENMVVFRDSEGRLGALDEQCSHRRASLAFAGPAGHGRDQRRHRNTNSECSVAQI